MTQFSCRLIKLVFSALVPLWYILDVHPDPKYEQTCPVGRGPFWYYVTRFLNLEWSESCETDDSYLTMNSSEYMQKQHTTKYDFKVN